MITGIAAQQAMIAGAASPALYGQTVLADGTAASPVSWSTVALAETTGIYDSGAPTRLTPPVGSLARMTGARFSSASFGQTRIQRGGSDFPGMGIYNGDPDQSFCGSCTHTAPLEIISGDYFEMAQTGNGPLYFGAEIIDPAFKGAAVYLATNTAKSTGWAPLAFDTVFYDTASYWSALNPTRLTIPSDGFYRITGNFWVSGASANGAKLLKNGAVFDGSPYDIGEDNKNVGSLFSPILFLSAGDYIELDCYASASATLQGNTGNWLAIEKVDSSIKRALVLIASQNVTISNPVVTWGTEVYDTDGIYDPLVPTRLTAPSGTTYARVISGLEITANRRKLEIAPNFFDADGNNINASKFRPLQTTNERSLTFSTPWMPMAAGDYVVLNCYSRDTNAVALNGHSFFSLECR